MTNFFFRFISFPSLQIILYYANVDIIFYYVDDNVNITFYGKSSPFLSII